MTTWYPIETIPSEGTFIVFLPNERRRLQIMVKHPNIDLIGNCFAFDLTAPTHWCYPPDEPVTD